MYTRKLLKVIELTVLLHLDPPHKEYMDKSKMDTIKPIFKKIFWLELNYK